MKYPEQPLKDTKHIHLIYPLHKLLTTFERNSVIDLHMDPGAALKVHTDKGFENLTRADQNEMGCSF